MFAAIGGKPSVKPSNCLRPIAGTRFEAEIPGRIFLAIAIEFKHEIKNTHTWDLSRPWARGAANYEIARVYTNTTFIHMRCAYTN